MSDKSDLKKAGLKATLPRLKILSVLEESGGHLGADDVYKTLIEAGEDVGLATVYRVLTQFEESGLLIRHNFEGGRSVYELNQGHHHDHMLCVKCGKVFEFFDEQIEIRQREIAKEKGFVIEDHTMHFYGMCVGMKENGKCSEE